MSSWNMLRIVRTATELVTNVYRITDRFPAEEKYVMVPVLRDTALTILENTAIGMARMDHTFRYIALSKAIKALNELTSRFILCKRIAALSEEDMKELKLKCDILHHQLDIAMKNVEYLSPRPLHPYE